MALYPVPVPVPVRLETSATPYSWQPTNVAAPPPPSSLTPHPSTHPALSIQTVTTAALALAGPAAADALANLAESARTSRGALLGQVELRYRQLQSSVHALVQDTLLARVRTGLQVRCAFVFSCAAFFF